VHIELLWIIPILSFVFFVSLVIYFAQKKSLQTDLKKEVINFNSGITHRTSKLENPEHRLEELEKAITIVTHSITNQQKIIDRFKRENTDYNVEINDLKDKLRELYKEYDIILSENYSLRAKMKKMMEQKNPDGQNASELPIPSILSDEHELEINPKSSKVNLKLYEDTRLLNIANLEDFENPRSKASF
jgi:septal ring factor EnvC (AmiA/AmiB activator)